MNIKALYEHDFQSWIQHHVALLKEARFSDMDLDNLIEELKGMSKRDKHELVSRFIVLIAHLLKWQHQKAYRINCWRSTIDEQRSQIDYLLEDVPSLKPWILEASAKAYSRAVELAAKETQLSKSAFPEQCPYTEKQLIDGNFYPEI